MVKDESYRSEATRLENCIAHHDTNLFLINFPSHTPCCSKNNNSSLHCAQTHCLPMYSMSRVNVTERAPSINAPPRRWAATGNCRTGNCPLYKKVMLKPQCGHVITNLICSAQSQQSFYRAKVYSNLMPLIPHPQWTCTCRRLGDVKTKQRKLLEFNQYEAKG